MNQISNRITGFRLLAAALLAAALLPAAAAASAAPPKVEFARYKVEVTGILVNDWHYQSQGWGTEAPGARGAGTQTTGFSTGRPMRFHAIFQRGTVKGIDIGSYAMAPLGAIKPLRGSIVRKGYYRTDDGKPVCEGGPQYCPDEGPGPQPKFQCPRLRPGIPVQLEAEGMPESGGAVVLAMTIDPPRRPYANCAPDHNGGVELLANAPIRDAWPASALKYLKRGQRDVFRGSRELFPGPDGKPRRGCPKGWDSGAGFRQCLTVDYTVEIRRVR